MSAPPDTLLQVSPEEAAAIRAAVRGADLATYSAASRIATGADAAEMLELFSDPRVSDPIYDLPRPFTLASMSAWIAEAEVARQRGEGLLFCNRGLDGSVMGYSKIAIWPERAAGELAGAKRANRQNTGTATRDGGSAFGWIFEALGVRIMCLTAALDNIRSARMIDAAGFVRKGERDAVRPDGSTRRSIYWELTREEWRARHGIMDFSRQA